MANVKITDLTAYTNPASTDVLPIVDVGADAGAGVTKKVSIADLLENAGSGTASAPGIAFDGDSNTGIYRPGPDQVAISTSGTQRLLIEADGDINIDSGGVFYDATNSRLAIGTTSPNYALDVVLGVGIQEGQAINWHDGTGSNSAQIYGDASDNLIFRNTSSNTERARIDSSGKFIVKGVGTEAFSVDGGAPNNSLIVDSSGRCLVGTASDSGNTTLVLQGNSAGASGTPTIACKRNITPSAGNDIAIISFGNVSGGEGANILAEGDGTWTNGSSHPTRLVFSVTEDGNSSPTSSPSAMTINSGQEVLIGYSADNGAYKLQVNSQIFATSATIATSDGRYKENVSTLGGCLDLVKALRPVSFTWKPQQAITRIDDEGEEVVVREPHNFPEGTQVGFIAQEVQEVLDGKPWLGSVIKENVRPAVTDNDGNELAPEEQFYGIAEGNLVAVLTNALQEATAKIEDLEARLTAAGL